MKIDQQASLTDWNSLLTNIDFLLEQEEVVGVEIPGAGNMNVVLRVKTNQRSFIAKQSRPFVQKYPDIPAPIERIAVEQAFYTRLLTAASASVLAHVPQILAYSAAHHLLLLEDLGAGEDLTLLYQQATIDNALLHTLVHLAHGIHQTSVSSTYPQNQELKALNHQHIFVLPFMEDNGFSLDSVQLGLSDLALPYQQDEQLKSAVEALGEKYLATGDTLLHGDYYPGSWMKRADKVFLLDPEFSYNGLAEFDIGVMAAHVLLITGDLEQLHQVLAAYPSPLEESLTLQFAGVEVLRRLIGLAQLPLERSLEEKAVLLQQAYALVLPSK